jgi:ATP-dependent DNA helicase RecG
MSATPIPRSLALSLYGDLDISTIKELPPGRKEADTILVNEEKRQWVYSFLKDKLREHRQVYIVYPLIEESDIEELKSLSRMYDVLKDEFTPYTVGVFHGKMKPRDKEIIIKDFRENKINILISTTVIEVGVNIENATVMVVENPERFGLAQLHQLRGRIRRSTHKPYFIIISGHNISDNAKERLQIIAKLNDGFKIAEEDLKLRGPGDFFGSMQAGLPPAKISDLLRDIAVLKEARSLAYRVIKRDPYLKESCHRCIKEYLDYRINR